MARWPSMERREDAARAITSALEGAMLLARPYGGAARFKSAAQRVLREFAPSDETAEQDTCS